MNKSTRTLVLLVNLGTPSMLTRQSIRVFLREFLADRRVVDLPKAFWLPILYGFILPFRPRGLLDKYRYVWMTPRNQNGRGKLSESMSCLEWHSNQLASRMQQHMNKVAKHDDIVVRTAMRYGKQSIKDVLGKEHQCEAGLRRVVVLPLFPQYSCSTSASIFDAVSSFYNDRRRRQLPSLHFIRDYAENPLYVRAVASSIIEAFASYYKQAGDPTQLAATLEREAANVALIFSYHSIPVQYSKDGDDYAERCQTTTMAVIADVAKTLQMPTFVDLTLHVYQSRFGPAEWLNPFLSEVVELLPQPASNEGVKTKKLALATRLGNVHFAEKAVRTCFVITPGFSTDCLETVHEIGEEARETFLARGGKDFIYVNALNDSPKHAEALTSVIDMAIKL